MNSCQVRVFDVSSIPHEYRFQAPSFQGLDRELELQGLGMRLAVGRSMISTYCLGLKTSQVSSHIDRRSSTVRCTSPDSKTEHTWVLMYGLMTITVVRRIYQLQHRICDASGTYLKYECVYMDAVHFGAVQV